MSRRITAAPLFVPLLAAALAGCGGWELPTRLDGSLPRKGSIVPNTVLQVTPSLSIPLEKVVYWGAYAGIAYLIVDPRAPNWAIEETPLADDHVHLALKMKRFHMGGDGEARVVFQRRARELVQFGNFGGYQIVEYNESTESSVFGGQRLCEGVIRLTPAETRTDTRTELRSERQDSAPPARSMADSTEKPRS